MIDVYEQGWLARAPNICRIYLVVACPMSVVLRLLEKVSPGNYSIVVYSEQESGRAKVLIQVQFLMLGI